MATVSSSSMTTRTPRSKKTSAERLKAAGRAAVLLKQASDATRLQILLTLVDGPQHVGALCEPLAMSQPAVSHHLALLRHGRIVESRRDGKKNFYALTDLGHRLASVITTLIG